jgi:diphosphoinositol-polyphosphate diphosphatase
MSEALTALLERLSVIEPMAAAQELTDQAGGMYMMLQTATSDGAVALC